MAIPDVEISAVRSNDTSTAKVSEEVNRKCPPRNTTVQVSTPYTDPQHHNVQRYRQTDRRRDERGTV